MADTKSSKPKKKPVFKLRSNKQFMGTYKESPDLHVTECTGDPRDYAMVNVEDHSWVPPTVVGPSDEATYEALEVFGVTIGGDKLNEMVEDLKVGGTICLAVNRQGLCFVDVKTAKGDKWMRVNDLFGWSKYGVVPEISGGDIWSICDMSNGDVLMGPPTVDASGEGEVWKKVVEVKEKVMEKTESLLRKSIEEKEKEAVALKAALRALTSRAATRN